MKSYVLRIYHLHLSFNNIINKNWILFFKFVNLFYSFIFPHPQMVILTISPSLRPSLMESLSKAALTTSATSLPTNSALV